MRKDDLKGSSIGEGDESPEIRGQLLILAAAAVDNTAAE